MLTFAARGYAPTTPLTKADCSMWEILRQEIFRNLVYAVPDFYPPWERSRSCAAQRYIRLAALLRNSARQVPAVRKAPFQIKIWHSSELLILFLPTSPCGKQVISFEWQETEEQNNREVSYVREPFAPAGP